MKKVLLTLCAVLMAVPAFAIEVYSNGDNSVSIYGHIRGYMGYGMGVSGDMTIDLGTGSVTGTDGSLSHNMMYGIQNNTRIGTNIKIGNFSSQFELAVNEKTLLSQASDAVGFRQAWAAYTFGNGSRLLVGKTDTPTVINFISSIYDGDNGLNGFGGTNTGFRRFQVQYSIAGLTLALIEDDVVDRVVAGDFNEAGTSTNAPYTPRAAISYVYQTDSLLAKIAATYTAVNGTYADANGVNTWGNIHAFGIGLGVKPTFGNMWVTVHARYGMNEDLYGEGGTYINNGTFSHAKYNTSSLATNIGTIGAFTSGGTVYNVHRAGAALEFGMKATENFTAIIGGGYQATIQEIPTNTNFMGVAVTDPSYLVHSYSVFLQGQYAFNEHFALVPEIAWFGTVANGSGKVAGQNASISDSESGLLVGLQFRASF